LSALSKVSFVNLLISPSIKAASLFVAVNWPATLAPASIVFFFASSRSSCFWEITKALSLSWNSRAAILTLFSATWLDNACAVL
jgi:hypothetical protein